MAQEKQPRGTREIAKPEGKADSEVANAPATLPPPVGEPVRVSGSLPPYGSSTMKADFSRVGIR